MSRAPARPTRTQLLDRLDGVRRRGEPIVAAGVGTGLTARSALDGGADLVVAYHSAPFRLAGVPSLAGLMPVANANDMVFELATALLAATPGAPLLATVCAADPFVDPDALLDRVEGLGFVGVLNAPTATLIDGQLRGQLEAAGLGFTAELSLMRRARRRDLLVCAYATTAAEADASADAGADVIILHLGVTHTASPSDRELDDAVERLEGIHEALAPSTRTRRMLCHGGPITDPAALGAVLTRLPQIDGYFGASTLEQQPIRRAVVDAAAAFKGTRAAPRRAAP